MSASLPLVEKDRTYSTFRRNQEQNHATENERTEPQSNNTQLSLSSLLSSQTVCYFLLVISSMAFSISLTSIHYIMRVTPTPYATILLFIYSELFLLTLLYSILFYPGLILELFHLGWVDFFFIVLRSIVGIFTVLFISISLRYLPSGDADAITFIAPVLTLLLSACFMKEPLTLPAICSALLAFFGAFIVSRGTSLSPSTAALLSSVTKKETALGCIFALLTALCVTAALLTTKKIVTKFHFMLPTLFIGFVGVVTSFLMHANKYAWPLIQNNGTWNFIPFIPGLVSFFGLVCQNFALKKCAVGIGGIVRSIEVPFVYILGVMFLGEAPSISSLIGSSLVVSATVFVALHEISRSK